MMKLLISASALLASAFFILAASPDAHAANCWWNGAGFACSPGWQWRDGREWREDERRDEWRDRRHREWEERQRYWHDHH